MTTRYSKLDPLSVANGPGLRVALFVSGCRMHCPGCFNESAQDFGAGEPLDDTVIGRVIELLARPGIAGLTVLGGEPLEPENQPALLALAEAVRKAFGEERTIWIYTGFVFERLRDDDCRAHTDVINRILDLTDVLVDGPFMTSMHEVGLRFKGSRNQRLIDLRATKAQGRLVLWDDGERRGRL